MGARARRGFARLIVAGAAAAVLAGAAVLAVGPALLAAPAAASIPTPAAPAGSRYVALGDSYAAGLGLAPAAGDAPAPGCGQSARNYPHRLATALGLQLVDRTCSGAVTADLAGSQQVDGSPVPPQLDALTADTRMVSLTIGGNDLGFSAIAAYCASPAGPGGPVLGGGSAGGGLADCAAHYDADGTDSLRARIDDIVTPRLVAALAAVRQRAPRAAIVVVDYPAIVPDAAHTPAGGCWTSPLGQADSLPFTDVDLPYLQRTEARLNQALDRAATSAGAGVAQVYPASLAHTPCGADPWVNGVLVTGLSVSGASLHPDEAGVAAMTAAATSVARDLLAGDAPPAPVDVAPGAGLPGWVWPVAVVVVLVVGTVTAGLLRIRRRLTPR